MKSFINCKAAGMICIAMLLGNATWARAQGARSQDPSITQISKSVYRWGSDNQFGVYILTSEGIIVVDGHYCQSNTTEWLKSELERRHAVPVKYVVLSHSRYF